MAYKNKEEKLQDNASENYNKFKEEILSKTKEEIYNHSYEIYFYSEVNDYIENLEETLPKETIDALLGLGSEVLDNLYDKFLKYEYSSVNSWDEIYDFLVEAASSFS